jgi:hypothetical protein
MRASAGLIGGTAASVDRSSLFEGAGAPVPGSVGRRVARGLLAFTALATVVVCSGCSIQPWVKPYERERLADPIMAFDRNPVSTSYLDHVFEAREGARGAGGGAGGGCGCN